MGFSRSPYWRRYAGRLGPRPVSLSSQLWPGGTRICAAMYRVEREKELARCLGLRWSAGTGRPGVTYFYYIGDTLHAEATVKSVRANRNMAELEFEVKSQDGDLVLEGEALVFQDDASIEQ